MSTFQTSRPVLGSDLPDFQPDVFPHRDLLDHFATIVVHHSFDFFEFIYFEDEFKGFICGQDS